MSNSPTIPAKCLGFYLQGRDDVFKAHVKDVIASVLAEYFGEKYPSDSSKDTSPEATSATPSVRDLVHRKVTEVASAKLRSKKRRWEAEHADAVRSAGVASDVAFDTYVMGCIDEAAIAIEDKVLEQVFAAYDEVGSGDAPDKDYDEDDDEEDDDDED